MNQSKVVVTGLLIDDWIKALPEKLDVIITDPPYPFDNKNGSGRFDFKDGEDQMYSRLTWNDFEGIYSKLYDATNNGGRAYIFCNRDGLFETKPLLEKIGWKFRNLLPWDKVRLGGGYHWRNVFEYIIYVSKGDPKTFIKNRRNGFVFPKPTKNNSIPAIGYNAAGTSPKPHEIWRDIMQYGCVDNDVCADPFAGSNPMKAAIDLYPDIEKKIKAAYTNVLDI